MIVHWEQLDGNEKRRWLSLTSDANLASYGQAVDRLVEVDGELRRFGIIFHPFRLLSGAFEQIRTARRLAKFRRAFRNYERSLAQKYDRHAPDDGEVFLVGFAKRDLVLELHSRGSEQLRRFWRDLSSV